MSNQETQNSIPRLITGSQDLPPPIPLEDQFDKILMALGGKFTAYRKKCAKALSDAQSTESYLIGAKFAEHVECWDIAISDVKELVASYRAGRAAEKAKLESNQNDNQQQEPQGQ
jgi:hypothetical protein